MRTEKEHWKYLRGLLGEIKWRWASFAGPIAPRDRSRSSDDRGVRVRVERDHKHTCVRRALSDDQRWIDEIHVAPPQSLDLTGAHCRVQRENGHETGSHDGFFCAISMGRNPSALVNARPMSFFSVTV